MRCDHTRRMLARKASRDLSARDQQMLASHLSSCAECAAFQDQLDRTWSALEYHPSLEVSEDFLPRLKAKLGAGEALPRSAWTWRPAWGWQWAALAVCITLAVVILTRGGQLRHSVPPANQGTSMTADRDQRDEQFLQDLEQTLQFSVADALSAYDSWPATAQESSTPEPSKAGPAKKMKQKEPS